MNIRAKHGRKPNLAQGGPGQVIHAFQPGTMTGQIIVTDCRQETGLFVPVDLQ